MDANRFFRSLLFGVRFEEENCMIGRKSLLLVVSALLLFGGATDAMSQQFTGSMRGTVSDAQGILSLIHI